MTSGSNEASGLELSRRTLLRGSALIGGGLAGAGAGMLAPAPAQAATSWGMKPVPLPEQVSAREGFADINGVKLSYWDTGGNGQPVVLLHPGTGSDAIWGYQQPVFAKAGYRVIAYSRRGYYRSERGPTTNIPTVTEDLLALTTQLGVDKFHAVGSAAGGITATDFALTHPERLYSLTLACTIGGVRDPEYLKLSASLRPKGFNEMPSDFQELGPSYRAADPEGVARWLELEHKALPGERVRAPYSSQITWANLEKMRVPTLLMTGDADLWTPPALLKLFAERIPNNEVVIIDGAGHSAYWEQPEAFNKAVLAFIAKHKG